MLQKETEISSGLKAYLMAVLEIFQKDNKDLR